MDLEQFKPLFGKWYDKFEPFLKTSDFSDIYAFLKTRSRMGKKILPLSGDLFKAFQLTDPQQINCIIVGNFPYSQLNKNQKPIADGLCLSASTTKEDIPTLKLFYRELKKQYDTTFYYNDFTELAERNGILLLNASFTCELNNPTIHYDKKVWDKFNQFLYKNILSDYCGIPFLLMGKEAKKMEKYLFPLCNVIKTIEHPMNAVQENTDWNSENCFIWINKVLKENNNTELNFEPVEIPF
jgi:uracil-DNA glycosylase